MEVFADTSFFIAYTSPRDRFHRRAVAALTGCEGRIVTTDWVLVELGNFFGGSPDRSKFAPFLSAFRGDPRFLILPPNRTDFDAGLRLYA